MLKLLVPKFRSGLSVSTRLKETAEQKYFPEAETDSSSFANSLPECAQRTRGT